MRCRFTLGEPVFAAKFFMDGREEVERTVHLCARKIKLLPHGMIQKSL
jgi:hypothetical protein